MVTTSPTPETSPARGRFHIATGTPLELCARFVSATLPVVIVDDLQRDTAMASRCGPLLFEIHRALRPGGLLLWTCAATDAAAVLLLAHRYGFSVTGIGVWIGPERTGNLLVLQRPPCQQRLGPVPDIPLVTRIEQDAGPRTGWGRIIDVLFASEAASDVTSDAWLVEIAAVDSLLAEQCIARGGSWLGQTVQGQRRALKADTVRRALVALGAREASLVPDLLSAPAAREKPRDLPELCFSAASLPAPPPIVSVSPNSPDVLVFLDPHAAPVNDHPMSETPEPEEADALMLGKVHRPRLGMQDLETPLRRTATG